MIGLFLKTKKQISSLLVAAMLAPWLAVLPLYPPRVFAQDFPIGGSGPGPEFFPDYTIEPINTSGGADVWGNISKFLDPKTLGTGLGSILGGDCQGATDAAGNLVSSGLQVAGTAAGYALSFGPIGGAVGGFLGGMVGGLFGKKKKGGGSSICEAIIDGIFDRLITKLVNDTVNWIQNKGQHRFSTNWKNIFDRAVDEAGGALLNELLDTNLCEPVRRAWTRGSPTVFFPQPLPTDRVYSCTLTDILENFKRGPVIIESPPVLDVLEYTATMLQPQNNIYGATLLATSEYQRRTELNKTARQSEAVAGRGFLSVRVCTSWYDRPDEGGELQTGKLTEEEVIASGVTCLPEAWQVLTPGEIISEAAGKAATKDYDILYSKLIRGSISSVFSALINAMVNRIASEGLAFMRTGKGSRTEPFYGTYVRLPEPGQTPQEQVDFMKSLTEIRVVLEILVTKSPELYQPYLDELTAIAEKAAQATNLGMLAELLPVVEGLLVRLSTTVAEDIALQEKGFRAEQLEKLDAIRASIDALDLSVTVNVNPPPQ